MSLINSLTSVLNPFNTTDEILQWIKERNAEVFVDIQQKPFDLLEGWFVDSDGSLRHASGKFFSIEGIHVETDYGQVPSWDQPIINQPEVGYLGILTKEVNGVLYFLMQAKIEPGNVNCVQISPTLQATKSNYSRVHKGKKPAYLDYFINATPEQIILDQLQSEQGARFLKKRNRNIIIKVEDDVELLEDFRWMTLAQIKELMHYDNMVNMDTRTVISGLKYIDFITPLTKMSRFSNLGRIMLNSARMKEGNYSINKHLSWLSHLKSLYSLSVVQKPIKDLYLWHLKPDEIVRDDQQFFRVIGVSVTISNREICSWSQPLVQPMQQGLCAFIIKEINGIYHFLVQAKLECGNMDIFELAPTVQCLTGNVYSSVKKPSFADYVLNATDEKIVYDTMQSEEGGRFYHEQNRNMIVEAGDDFPDELPERYAWMTLGQINEFMRYNNFLNIQARSILAAIKYI